MPLELSRNTHAKILIENLASISPMFFIFTKLFLLPLKKNEPFGFPNGPGANVMPLETAGVRPRGLLSMVPLAPLKVKRARGWGKSGKRKNNVEKYFHYECG